MYSVYTSMCVFVTVSNQRQTPELQITLLSPNICFKITLLPPSINVIYRCYFPFITLRCISVLATICICLFEIDDSQRCSYIDILVTLPISRLTFVGDLVGDLEAVFVLKRFQEGLFRRLSCVLRQVGGFYLIESHTLRPH